MLDRHGEAPRGPSDPRLLDLCPRTRNCLYRARIYTLAELAAQTDEQLLSIRNFGAVALFEVKELLARYEMELQTPDPEPEYLDYGPYVDRLAEAAGMDLSDPKLLSSAARHFLREHGITSASLLILVSTHYLVTPHPHLMWQAEPSVLREINVLQIRLAARFGLADVAGTANLREAEAVEREVGERRYCEVLTGYAQVLRQEVASGRLREDVDIVGPDFSLEYDEAPRTIGELLEVLDAPDEAQIRTGPWSAEVARRLVEALGCGTCEEEMRRLSERVPERELRVWVRSELDGSSNEAIAQELIISRTRVRQLRDAARERIRRAALVAPLPCMRTAIRVATDLVKAGRGEDAEEELRRRGLIRGSEAFALLLVFWREVDLEEPYLAAGGGGKYPDASTDSASD